MQQMMRQMGGAAGLGGGGRLSQARQMAKMAKNDPEALSQLMGGQLPPSLAGLGSGPAAPAPWAPQPQDGTAKAKKKKGGRVSPPRGARLLRLEMRRGALSQLRSELRTMTKGQDLWQ